MVVLYHAGIFLSRAYEKNGDNPMSHSCVVTSNFLGLCLNTQSQYFWFKHRRISTQAQQYTCQPFVLLRVQVHAESSLSFSVPLNERGQMRFAFQSQDTTRRQMDL